MSSTDSIMQSINTCLKLVSTKPLKSNNNNNNNSNDNNTDNKNNNEIIKLTNINIINTSIESNVVLYEIRVESNYKVLINNKLRNLVWHITRRFQEFYNLNQLLEQQEIQLIQQYQLKHNNNNNDNNNNGNNNNKRRDDKLMNEIILPPCPSKQFWFFFYTDHTDKNFIDQRLVLLENYLVKLINNPIWKYNKHLLNFLSPNEQESLIHNKLNVNYIDNHNNSKQQSLSNNTTQANSNNLENSDSNNEDKRDVNDIITVNVSNNNINQLYLNRFVSVSNEVSLVTIPTAQILRGSHIVFHVCVESLQRPAEYCNWTILKRFSEFVKLDNNIRLQLTQNNKNELLLQLPPLPHRSPKILIDHLHIRFIEERRILLQLYLHKLLNHSILCDNTHLLKFLGCT